MESTEIQLFSDTFDVNQLTSQENRENLYLSINQLDETKLTEIEIRQNFTGIKVALGVFIQKFAELEGEVSSLYQLTGIPTTFFIDGDGIIRLVDAEFNSPEELEDIFNAISGALPIG